jgi:hypothetical protein
MEALTHQDLWPSICSSILSVSVYLIEFETINLSL